MLEEPKVLQTDAQLTAVIRFTIPREQIKSVMGPGIQEVMTVIAEQGIAATGPVFSHHLRMDPKIFDFEVGVPVAAAVSSAGRVTGGQLPAATIARTICRGSHEGLGPAWGEFDAWVAAQGHTPAQNLWECYVAGPESDPDPAPSGARDSTGRWFGEVAAKSFSLDMSIWPTLVRRVCKGRVMRLQSRKTT